MWQECLDSWDSVTIAAPCQNIEPPKFATRVDGYRVHFQKLRFSSGYFGALQAIPDRFQQLRSIVRNHDAVVLHTPSDLGALACFWARRYGIPYGLDIRGDQSVNTSYLRERGTPLPNLTASAFRWLFSWVRAEAVCAIYVSRELAVRFPIAPSKLTSIYSDVRIPLKWFKSPRNYLIRQPPWKICSVGRIEAQKGYSYLLEACAKLANIDRNLFRLELIGQGPLEGELREKVRVLGIGDLITLRGFVPWGPELFELLQQCDLFVLPSITEGMPRVIIEAMAGGLPIVASSVGGIPEIVSPDYLVPPRDVQALTNKLLDVLQNPQLMTQMSVENCQFAANFHPDKMQAGKKEFYSTLRLIVEETMPNKQTELPCT